MTFGPAYEYNFLLKVFELQVEIEQLGQEDGTGLEHICFAPMTQVGEATTLRQCTVQSLFGYFKNNFAIFNQSSINEETGYTSNYLNRVVRCTQNSFTDECMAPYGGPIEPAIAIGGLPKPEPGQSVDYKMATGMVLTFLVRNHMNKSLLGPAEEWEKKFMDHMKEFNTNGIMDFAYSAERSIEDGIDDMSKAESYT